MKMRLTCLSLLRGSILCQFPKYSYGSFPAAIQRGVPHFQRFSPRAYTSAAMDVPRPLDPATRHIYYMHKTRNYGKWGWVFYRCTYNNDEEWNSFKRLISEEMHNDMVADNTPDIYRPVSDSLALTFFEDKDKFDGVSRDQLRTHFQRWAVDAYPAENPRAKYNFDPEMAPPPRYRYFVQIDEESLRSIIDDPNNAQGMMRRWGYVNYVDGWWKSLSEAYAENQDPQLKEDIEGELEEGYEPIDGCLEGNVGWMMLDTIDMSPSFYHYIWGFPEETWYLCYQRPPGIASW